MDDSKGCGLDRPQSESEVPAPLSDLFRETNKTDSSGESKNITCGLQDADVESLVPYAELFS